MQRTLTVQLQKSTFPIAKPILFDKESLLEVIMEGSGPCTAASIVFKGTVQRKLRGVLSGINRKQMIWAWTAWG
jgi:hypothetical protein